MTANRDDLGARVEQEQANALRFRRERDAAVAEAANWKSVKEPLDRFSEALAEEREAPRGHLAKIAAIDGEHRIILPSPQRGPNATAEVWLYHDGGWGASCTARTALAECEKGKGEPKP